MTRLGSSPPTVCTSAEEWRCIPGFEGRYEVSSLGRVKSYVGGPTRILRQHIRRHRYLSVRLYSGDGSAKRYTVHRLVLSAFHGPCPPGHEGCHRDGDMQNNRSDNLYWGTREQNMADIKSHGRNFYLRKTHCIHGHEFTPENTKISSYNGQRVCRECCRIRDRKYRRARSSA